MQTSLVPEQPSFISDPNYYALVDLLTLNSIATADQVTIALGERCNLWPLSVAPAQPALIEVPVDPVTAVLSEFGELWPAPVQGEPLAAVESDKDEDEDEDEDEPAVS